MSGGVCRRGVAESDRLCERLTGGASDAEAVVVAARGTEGVRGAVGVWGTPKDAERAAESVPDGVGAAERSETVPLCGVEADNAKLCVPVASEDTVSVVWRLGDDEPLPVAITVRVAVATRLDDPVRSPEATEAERETDAVAELVVVRVSVVNGVSVPGALRVSVTRCEKVSVKTCDEERVGVSDSRKQEVKTKFGFVGVSG